ncbi:hypothetical protein ESCOMMO158M_25365 [Escherichia coli]
MNAKRVYRIMSENSLLLLHDKPSRPQREHKGRISVKESDQCWCSDGFEFGCDDGEKLRVTFALVTNGAKVIHIQRLKSDPGVNLLF